MGIHRPQIQVGHIDHFFKCRVQFRIHRDYFIGMVVNVVDIVHTGNRFLRCKHTVSIDTGFLVGALQQIIHSSSRSIGKIVLQCKFLAAIALIAFDLDLLPAWLFYQQLHKSCGKRNNTNQQKHRSRNDPQFLILFRYFCPDNRSGFSHNFTLS